MYPNSYKNQPNKMISIVNTLLNNRNIQVPDELIQAIADCHSYFLFETEEGRKTVLQKCNMDWEPGQSDVVYKVADTFPQQTLKGDEVFFYKIAVSKGQFFKPNHLDDYYVDKRDCTLCHTEVHCATDTQDEYGRNAILCDHCRSISNDERLRKEGTGCKGCSLTDCRNHPHSMAFLKEIR